MTLREIRDYEDKHQKPNPTILRAFDDELSFLGARIKQPDAIQRWYCLRYRDYVEKLCVNPLYGRYLEKFHFDFIENGHLNAVTSFPNGVALVGCFSGAVKNISSFFCLALSHPGVLRDVGDSTREQLWIRSLKNCKWCDTNWEVMRNIDFRQMPPNDLPIDADRKLFAHRLAILAMDFLFFHELGHIVNRHLEFLSDLQETLALEEMGFIRQSSRKPQDYQALELNADAHSVFVMTKEWFMVPKNLPATASFETASEAVESLVLAMLCIFIMFDQTASTIKDYSSARHPHPAVRLANVYAGTFELIHRLCPNAQNELKAAWDRGFERAHQMCSALNIGSSVWYSAEHEMDSIFETHGQLASRFQGISRQLRST